MSSDAHPLLTPSQQQAAEQLLDLVSPLRVRLCPWTPTPRQEAFLRLTALEALFGGAAGGGKSIALLMSALQYADVPGYHALLLRPSLLEFEFPGGLIELAHDWLAATTAEWSGETRTWRFPGPGRSGTGGATLRFGYLDGIKDVVRYAGASFSFIGFDELTRLQQAEYQRMFRGLRQPNGATTAAAADGRRLSDVPIRARATSNPGGIGHAWVKSYFVDPASRHDDAVFLPARLVDNPFLDRESYLESLAVLPHAERERLLHGDWNIPDDGEIFQRSWFEELDRVELPTISRSVRYWDLAATEPSSASPDPDFSVGLRLDLDDKSGIFYISDIVRLRKAAGAVERAVAATANRDGPSVAITIEEEPGAAGRAVTDRYKRHILRGYTVRSERPTGPKTVRATGAAAAAENGLIKIIRGTQTNDLLDELAAFPHGLHDDCVDALAGAHRALSQNRREMYVYPAPRGNIYEIAERAARRRGRRSPREIIERHERLSQQDAQLAARLGVPLHNPRNR
jgi:predicted phage terminase large subunit-like protein